MRLALVLLRHGQAGRARPGGGDLSRPLTPTGRAAVGRTARALVRLLGGPPALLLSSPAARCIETAEIVRAEGGRGTAVEKREALGLDASGEDVLRLAETAPAGAVLVGHQPTLVCLARGLCERGLPARFDLAPAWAAGLAHGKGGIEVAWLAGPDDADDADGPGAS